MANPTVFRLCVLMVATAVAVIGTGPFGGKPHLLASGLYAILLLAVTVMMRHRVAYVSVLLFLVVGGTGRMVFASPALAVIHEVTGHVLLSLACFLAVVAWPGTAVEVEDSGRPPLRSLARWMPPVIFIQVFHGALFRHHIISIAFHVFGAMLTGALIMFVGISVMILPGVGKVLRTASWALLSATFLQFLFGITAYLNRTTALEGGLAAVESHAAVSHIVTGGLTMGFSVVVALLVNRYVRPAEAVTA